MSSKTIPQDQFTQDAMKIIGAPRYVTISGKKMSPSILFSPALAESMLYWSAQAKSHKLFGKNILNISIVADFSRIAFARIERLDHAAAHSGTGDVGLGLATSLLVVSHAMDEILQPSRSNPRFDFEDVVLLFRDSVSKRYQNGETIKHGDIQLNNVFHDKICKPSRDSFSRPGTTGHVRKDKVNSGLRDNRL
ncbi:hypothetical protein [Alteromonas sp. 14N.309.X.WAT.G.H12]|uniref:hypothetical protein n=1 Tax=Alteromonas sp. 14N.309.X.WAT.G.H12 TaxID=3120824 RepID=UPI002FD011F7